MKINGNIILITGGTTGIGFALAEKFLGEGNEVIVCGRRKSKLQEAKHKLPAIYVKRCDISVEEERQNLLRWTRKHFPNLNMLVNNAGIQRQINFTSSSAAKLMLNKDDEIAINLSAPIHLCALFIPILMKRQKAAIINISSGLAFVPIATMPIYCATKAAIHSFTISLRHQLKNTSIKIIEVAPPTTDTELDHGFTDKKETYRGISPHEVATEILKGVKADKKEIIIGEAEDLYTAMCQNPEAIFNHLNN